MTLAGIAWFGRDLDWFDSAVAEHASELSLNLFLALVAHQLVVFPEGTARSRLERLLVLAVYGLAVLGYVPSEVSDTAKRHPLDGRDRPRRPRPLRHRPALARGRYPRAARDAAADRPRASGHDRRGRVARARLHRHRPLRTGEEALRWCAVVYAGLPIAFLLGVLRTHIRRAILGRLLADLGRGAVYDDAALEEAAAAARRALRSGSPLPRLDELTPRELEVLALIAQGRTDRGIAKELYVTPKTVEAHVRSIFRKLDLPREETENRRVHAVLTFLSAPTP